MQVAGGAMSFVRRYLKAQQGAAIFLFALIILPLMAAVGGLVDYGLAMRARSQLAATIDAAVLAAQLQRSQDDEADFQQIIRDYLAKNLTETSKDYGLTDVNVGEIVVSEEGELSAHISAKIAMHFLRLIGIDEIEVGVNAAAKVGGSSVEVVLALDNTGSMAGAKIAALKSAAKDLVQALMIKPHDPKVKFALVPFADEVNVGMENRNEPGLDIPNDYSFTPSGSNCWDTYPNSTQSCTSSTESSTCWDDGQSYSCDQTQWTCTGELGDPVQQCGSYWTLNYQWHGCMGSRAPDLTVTDDDYATQGVPGVMSTWNNCHVAPLTRLTTDKGDIISSIEAMNASGFTYIPAGLAWGWRVLSPQAPFSDAAAYDKKGVRKVLVLMTDGANTHSAIKVADHSTMHHASSDIYYQIGADTETANTITSATCDNIKAAGIMLYTISFDVASDPGIQTLLHSCAGNGGQFYNADNASQLADAFRHIGLSLLNLRLSR
jgi:Flp pilus assembly protein TadG